MIYRRTFLLESCHFNDQAQYNDLAAADKARDKCNFALEATLLRGLLFPIHGHNFKVHVEIGESDNESFLSGTRDWIVDDVLLEATVNVFNRCNLSMHELFRDSKHRATTERLAEAIGDLIRCDALKGLKNLKLVVRVWEKDDIEAEYTTLVAPEVQFRSMTN